MDAMTEMIRHEKRKKKKAAVSGGQMNRGKALKESRHRNQGSWLAVLESFQGL